jgi:hypothetical protein
MIPRPSLIPPPLERRQCVAPIPISFAQERLWLLKRLQLVRRGAPELPIRLKIQGELDVGALQRSFAVIEIRHEILRTRFQVSATKVRQCVLPPRANSMTAATLVDLTNLDRDSQLAQLSTISERMGSERFDLEKDHLIRLSLVRLSPLEHVLLLKIHHIIFDGWSLTVLLKELGVLYSAITSSDPWPPLPELPVQYADYAIWQRNSLTESVLASQVSYWRKRLSGVAPLRLPTDRPRPLMPSCLGQRVPIEFSAPATAALQGIARREGATLYMALLAVFLTLLGRWSGQKDVTVGSTVSCRNHSKLEPLIGFFLNILVIRANFGTDPSYRELLGQVKQSTLEAYAHQDISFERLVTTLCPERDRSLHPLFQAQFVFQNTPEPTSDLLGLEIQLSMGERLTARCDIALELRDGQDGLRGHVTYPTELFENATMARFCRQMQSLVTAIAAAPDRQLSAVVLPGD